MVGHAKKSGDTIHIFPIAARAPAIGEYVSCHRITAVVGLLAIGIGVWALIDPLLPASAEAILQNPSSHQIVTCRASFARGFGRGYSSEEAVAVCVDARSEHGFHLIRGASLIFDWSPEHRNRAQRRWQSIFPKPCRLQGQA
jgi:hypothetical protein